MQAVRTDYLNIIQIKFDLGKFTQAQNKLPIFSQTSHFITDRTDVTPEWHINIYIYTSNRLPKGGKRTSAKAFFVVYLETVLYKLDGSYLKYLVHTGNHSMLI